MTPLILFFLLVCCGFSGVGMWWGYEVGRGDRMLDARREAVIIHDAYQQGFTDGAGTWIELISRDQPYDWNAER